MADSDDDLRATAEDIAADATRLAEIENQKASLETDDPKLKDLSAESEELAKGLVPKTAAESALVEETTASSA